jgi:phosphoglycolate phosphatase-like HAD superfamily hydrolase
MIAVGVTTGAVGAAELVAAGAKVVVADLTELLTELRRRGTVR